MTTRNQRRAWKSRLTGTLLGLLLTTLVASQAYAITVENVIQMHKSSLPPAVIVQTISSTGSTFNLSVDDLKALEKAGVSPEVMEAMMSTGGGGAAPAPEPAPEAAPEVDELDQLRQAEDAERGKIEGEARVREAARRAAEAERSRIVAASRRRTAEALKAAREALDDKDYYIAAQKFDAFLAKSEPKKPSTYAATLGFADALLGLKLYGNAAEVYHSLLAVGAESETFVPAFEGLRKCAREVSYNPVTLEALTNYFVGNAPQEFQDSYNYFLGKFFFDYDRYEDARKYLGTVSEEGADYGEAQYLLGLSLVQDAGDDQESAAWARTLIQASGNFQGAVMGARTGQRVRHLAYLALARIAYSLGSFDAAIFYYRKVPTHSTSYINALHESGWSYFLKGDKRRGMGIFHTLDGPDWEHYFLPDTYLLEATVYMNNCRFDYAHEALKRIEDRYLALRGPLGSYMAEYALPEDLYKAFVLKQTRKGIELPHLLRMATISNDEFYDLYTTVTRYRREVARIKAERDRFGAGLADRLLATVESAHQERTLALGIKLNQILQGLDDELSDLEVQVTEIRIEIDEEAADVISKDIEGIYHEGTAEEVAAKAQKAAMVFVGDKYMTWPFEGEYWGDEINSYRSDMTEVCK